MQRKRQIPCYTEANKGQTYNACVASHIQDEKEYQRLLYEKCTELGAILGDVNVYTVKDLISVLFGLLSVKEEPIQFTNWQKALIRAIRNRLNDVLAERQRLSEVNVTRLKEALSYLEELEAGKAPAEKG